MSLTYKLDYTIRLAKLGDQLSFTRSDDPSFWWLEELDKDGYPIGTGYRPWLTAGFSITAKSLELKKGFRLFPTRATNFITVSGNEVYEEDSIVGICDIHSAYAGNNSLSLSFFGTDRKIKSVSLSIFRCTNSEARFVTLDAIVSYLAEGPYGQHYYEPDHIGICVNLSSSQYDSLKEFLLRGRAIRCRLDLEQVAGFYAEVDDFLPTNIKILTKDQQVLGSDQVSFELPTTISSIKPDGSVELESASASKAALFFSHHITVKGGGDE